MEWFYEKEGKQNGPVGAADLVRKLDTGELSLKSLVWREGMADWQPMEEAGVLKSESGEGLAVCAYSGEVKVKSEMVPYGRRWVLPEYREAFVQQLMEGAPLEGDGELSDYEVRISRSLSQAWQLLAEDFWPVVGVTAAIFVGYMVASQLPMVGMVAGLIATPLFAGLSYYMILKVRGQNPRFEDGFSGFKRNFLQLFVMGLVSSLIVLAVMIPGFLAIIGGVVAIEGISEPVGISIIVCGVVLIFLPYVYLYTAWMFASLLCIDKEIDFWPAMSLSMKTVNKHWFSCFLFALVISLLNMAGVVVFCVGVFFTLPWTILAFAYFYEEVFGRQRVNQLELEVE